MNSQKVYGILLGIAICAVAAAIFIYGRPGNNISIRFSDTDDELEFSASFPDEYSDEVHDFVKSQLRMNDLSDMKYLEVKHYETPDQRMRFDIKSRKGFLKITMDKRENSREGYALLRRTGERIKTIVTSR